MTKKVALVHYWLVGMRGGERVLESLCRMFPDADIYTHVVDHGAISKTLARHEIKTTFISKLPLAKRLYPKYLPLMPLALESLDLTGYDLIISNEAGPAKGIVPGPDTPHLCYCCSPMRYIWDQYHMYRGNAGFFTRFVMPPLAHYLRMWDVTSSARVDHFMADSRHVANRITKFFRRPAAVVYPPVAIEEFRPVPQDQVEDYYLWAGQLVRYKRPDIAIEAFKRNGKKLVVVGQGEERERLERDCGDNITFLGGVPFSQLKEHFARCKALIFPGEEDFGIVPVEVQAAGRPVIAYGKGGALDTVIDGKTGILFKPSTTDGLIAAIERFEQSGLAERCADDCVANAAGFSEANFQAGVREALAEVGFDYPEFEPDAADEPVPLKTAAQT